MLKKLLEKYNFKLAVAESLTGGKLSAKICNEAGISKYYLGSVTSYTCDIKNRVLGVAKELLDEQGPYNFETTRQMCDGVMSLMNSDVAVATSGVAGPGPDLGVEQGTYYITVKVKHKYFDKLTVPSKIIQASSLIAHQFKTNFQHQPQNVFETFFIFFQYINIKYWIPIEKIIIAHNTN